MFLDVRGSPLVNLFSLTSAENELVMAIYDIYFKADNHMGKGLRENYPLLRIEAEVGKKKLLPVQFLDFQVAYDEFIEDYEILLNYIEEELVARSGIVM